MYNTPSISDAMALVLRYDKLGNPYSLIVNKDGLEKSTLSPSKILDNQLRLMGSSLKGAKDAAAYALDSTSMFPMAVQLYPTINVWFPSESTRNENCVYLSVHQIWAIYRYSDTESIVYGYGNYRVVIPVEESKLKTRYQLALRYLGLVYCNQYLRPSMYTVHTDIVELHCAEQHTDYFLN